MSIRVLYDAGGFREAHGGVSRYFTEMMKRLPHEIEWKLGMVGTANEYLKQPPFNIPQHRQTVHEFITKTLHGHSFRGVSYLYKMLARVMPNRFPSGELANERVIVRAYREGCFDVLHLTHPHPVENTWRYVVGKKPIVVTVHDLIPEILQGNKRVAKCRRQLLRDATHIIAVSENTKRDIIKLYGTQEEKVSVIYHGFLMLNSSSNNARVVLPPSPYVLYVGKRNGYKNFVFFIESIAPLMKERGLWLFCIGGAFTDGERELISRLGIGHQTIQRIVQDSEMAAVYSHAVAFVYPSVYEGFGIPILDAFNAGCPVVLSRCSCFPEVAGDAALYFDKDDAETLRGHILDLVCNHELRTALVVKGRKRVTAFSWERCASETALVYRNVLGR